ncbi:MAG: hypothetical protein AAFR04_09390 [Pseudomonadota bacterium]
MATKREAERHCCAGGGLFGPSSGRRAAGSFAWLAALTLVAISSAALGVSSAQARDVANLMRKHLSKMAAQPDRCFYGRQSEQRYGPRLRTIAFEGARAPDLRRWQIEDLEAAALERLDRRFMVINYHDVSREIRAGTGDNQRLRRDIAHLPTLRIEAFNVQRGRAKLVVRSSLRGSARCSLTTTGQVRLAKRPPVKALEVALGQAARALIATRERVDALILRPARVGARPMHGEASATILRRARTAFRREVNANTQIVRASRATDVQTPPERTWEARFSVELEGRVLRLIVDFANQTGRTSRPYTAYLSPRDPSLPGAIMSPQATRIALRAPPAAGEQSAPFVRLTIRKQSYVYCVREQPDGRGYLLFPSPVERRRGRHLFEPDRPLRFPHDVASRSRRMALRSDGLRRFLMLRCFASAKPFDSKLGARWDAAHVVSRLKALRRRETRLPDRLLWPAMALERQALRNLYGALRRTGAEEVVELLAFDNP